MATILGEQLDNNWLELLKLRLQNLAAAPGSAQPGWMYYDTVLEAVGVRTASTWVYLGAGGYSDENARDAVAAALVEGSNISITVDDGADSITIGVEGLESTDLSDFSAAVGTIVDAAIASLVDSSPATLDTLNELAAALGDDPNFAATMTAALAAKPDVFSAAVGDGATTAIVVTHNLNTRNIIGSCRLTASPYTPILILPVPTTVNTATFNFATAPAVDEYTVTIVAQ